MYRLLLEKRTQLTIDVIDELYKLAIGKYLAVYPTVSIVGIQQKLNRGEFGQDGKLIPDTYLPFMMVGLVSVFLQLTNEEIREKKQQPLTYDRFIVCENGVPIHAGFYIDHTYIDLENLRGVRDWRNLKRFEEGTKGILHWPEDEEHECFSEFPDSKFFNNFLNEYLG